MTRPRFLVVMPFVVPAWAQACLATCRFGEGGDFGRLLTVDNSVVNRGIMRSHNMGIDAREPDEWLIIMSAALRFGKPGGMDFIDHLVERADHGVISASGTYGWHLVAFRPDVVAKMGRWDENFTPYGYDDNDLSIRIHRLMPDLIWGGYPLDVQDMGMAHSIKIGGVYSDPKHLLHYWRIKWGAPPGSEFDDYNEHPFGNPSNHINYWPDINGAGWDRPWLEKT